MSARSERWFKWLAAQGGPRVLDLGARGGDDIQSGFRAEALRHNPHAVIVGYDMQPGKGVDVVGDAHEIASHFPPRHFDAVWCAAMLEHVRRPWIVVEQLAHVVRGGGFLYLQTHQTFPYHAHPNDYFRFSTAAIRELFTPELGWRVLDVEHEFPCRVLPLSNNYTHARDWNFEAPAWLNVDAAIERVAHA